MRYRDPGTMILDEVPALPDRRPGPTRGRVPMKKWSLLAVLAVPAAWGASAMLKGDGSLYKVSPMVTGTTPLLIGTIPEKSPEPVAWTHTYGPRRARVFYSPLGHPQDFDEPESRRLLANGISWALDRPAAEAEVK